MKNLIISLAFLIGHTAFTADFHSPRTASMGGAGHAGPMLNDSIYLNPSYASFLPTYSVSYSYLSFKGNPDQNTEYHGRNFNISIQDGRSALFQAGVGYSVREDGQVLNIGGSKNFATAKDGMKRMGVGIGGKFLFGNEDKPTARDIIISNTYLVSKGMQVALIVDNALQSSQGDAWGLKREFIFGSKFILMGQVMAYIDPHYVPSIAAESKFGWEAGLEFGMTSDLFLRGGHFKNAAIPFQNGARGGGYGLGVGWMAPKLSIDYGYQRVLISIAGRPTGYAHTVGGTAFF